MRNKMLLAIAKAKDAIQTILVLLLVLATANMVLAQNLRPRIQVLPGTKVEVGEMVVFNAEGTTYTPDQTWVRRGLYEWNFDSTAANYAANTQVFRKLMSSPYKNINPSGMSVAHYFMKPGTYVVELTVNLWGTWTGAQPAVILTTSTDTRKIANPFNFIGALAFKTLDKNLNWSPGCHLTIRSDGGTTAAQSAGALMMQGTVISYDKVTGVLEFRSEFAVGTGGTYSSWNILGSPILGDATGTTSATITVTGTAPVAGFEIQHAPFYNRTKQYLYIQVPATYRTSSYDLKLSIIDTTADPDETTILLTKNNPTAEEVWLLDHTALTAGHDYVLQAQILKHSDRTQITGGIWREKFTKPTVAPVTTIDENNSFTWKGNLVYPIQFYMLDTSMEAPYTADKYGNGWHTYGCCFAHTPTNYATYIDHFASISPTSMATGPGRGDFQWIETAYNTKGLTGAYKMNHLLSRMTEYFTAAKDKTSVFMISTQDEPNMGSAATKAYLPTLAAWEYAAHAADPSHPAQVGYLGADWLTQTSPGAYDYQRGAGIGSDRMFGGKKWTPTTFGYDVLPYVGRLTAVLNYADRGILAEYFYGKEKMRAWNAPTSKVSDYNYLTSYINYKELIPMTAAVKPNTLTDIAAVNVSKTMRIGSISFTVTPGLNYHSGQPVTIAKGSDPWTYEYYTKVMYGTVTSYDGSTGVLVINVTRMIGSGTGTYWLIAAEYPEQPVGEVYSMAWMEFIHGAKGQIWFNWFDQSSLKWADMKKFTTAMGELQSKLLIAPTARVIIRTDKDNAALDRVDTYIRESGGVVYIVAARFTEPAPLPSVCWVTLKGTPSTVITNGKIRDTNGKIWKLDPSVTIGAGGTVKARTTCETLGNIAAAVNTLTTIETSVTGWSSVTNAAAATAGSKYTGVEPASITPAFKVSGLSGTLSASVYGESRNVAVVDGVFTDTFSKNDVHIYQIAIGPKSTSKVPH